MKKLPSMEESTKSLIQKKFFEFALDKLICDNRETFQPIWTIESWVKLLIWSALNCGLAGDSKNLESFGDALGPTLTRRMRKIFFERKLEDLGVHVMGDPADEKVILMPLSPGFSIDFEKSKEALEQIGLLKMVDEKTNKWQEYDDLIAIPWKVHKSSN